MFCSPTASYTVFWSSYYSMPYFLRTNRPTFRMERFLSLSMHSDSYLKYNVNAVDQDLFEVFCPLTGINMNEYLVGNKLFTGYCKNHAWPQRSMIRLQYTNNNGFALADQIVDSVFTGSYEPY